jgi:hypothetical protein
VLASPDEQTTFRGQLLRKMNPADVKADFSSGLTDVTAVLLHGRQRAET